VKSATHPRKHRPYVRGGSVRETEALIQQSPEGTTDLFPVDCQEILDYQDHV